MPYLLTSFRIEEAQGFQNRRLDLLVTVESETFANLVHDEAFFLYRVWEKIPHSSKACEGFHPDHPPELTAGTPATKAERPSNIQRSARFLIFRAFSLVGSLTRRYDEARNPRSATATSRR